MAPLQLIFNSRFQVLPCFLELMMSLFDLHGKSAFQCREDMARRGEVAMLLRELIITIPSSPQPFSDIMPAASRRYRLIAEALPPVARAIPSLRACRMGKHNRCQALSRRIWQATTSTFNFLDYCLSPNTDLATQPKLSEELCRPTAHRGYRYVK